MHRGVHHMSFRVTGGTPDPRNHAGLRSAPWVQMGGTGLEPVVAFGSGGLGGFTPFVTTLAQRRQRLPLTMWEQETTDLSTAKPSV